MRQITTVIDNLLKIVPECEEDTYRHLVWLRNTAAYTPPENMGIMWANLTKTMNKHFLNNWQIEAFVEFVDYTGAKIENRSEAVIT